jgi:transcription elongation factor Elf1
MNLIKKTYTKYKNPEKTWTCGRCGHKTKCIQSMRAHLKRKFPCDVIDYVVDSEIMDALDKDKTNFNIFKLEIMKQ